MSFGSLVKSPLTNFKSLTGSKGVLAIHKQRNYHKDAVAAYNNLRVNNTIENVIKSIPKSKEVKLNREALKTIIKTIYVFCSQNIALRGHRDAGRVEKLGDELINTEKGNFKAVLGLLRSCSKNFDQFMNESNDNAQYTSWDIQNQIINLLASNILERMAKEINQYVGDSRSTRPLIIQEKNKCCL